MKQEHEYRLEQMRHQDQLGGPASGGGPRVVGGGRPLQPKSLRGGGGVNRSFNWGDNRSNSMTGEDLSPGGGAGNGVAGGNKGSSSATAMAVVSAEAVPVEDYEDSTAPAAAAPAPMAKAKSSVFSRMLKGQK